MKNEITLQTRRQFLRSTVLGSALSWTVPAFLASTFDALQSEARRCGAELMTRGMAMKDIGQDMQRRGAEMEKNENTR